MPGVAGKPGAKVILCQLKGENDPDEQNFDEKLDFSLKFEHLLFLLPLLYYCMSVVWFMSHLNFVSADKECFTGW